MRTSVRAALMGLTTALGLTAGAGAAQAQCSLKGLQVLSEGVVVSYDPFDRTADRTQIPLRVTASGCENARLELTVVPEIDSLSSSGRLQASNGAEALPVEMTLDGAAARIVANPLNAFDTTIRPARLAGRSGQIEGQGLQIALPYGAEVAPGRYRARANLVARVLDESGTPGPEVTTPFFVEVDVQASFRLAAGVERARLWLGELTEGGRSEPLTFLAFSNTRYALKVKSERGGRMTLDGVNGADAPGVPYRLSISGNPVDWTDGIGEQMYGRPRLLLRTHEVVATTGAVDSRRPAGDYKDWVTIEISPLIS